MSGIRKRGFIRLDEDSSAQLPKKWGLPEYGDPTHQQERKTAINYDPGYVPSPKEAETQVATELTEQEIELIKQVAYQEGLEKGEAEGYQQGFSQGKEAGWQVGHEEGTEQGKAQGIVEGQAQIQEQVTRLMSIIDAFTHPLQQLDQQVEKQLVDMVLTLTKEIVKVEVQTHPQMILDTVKKCVEALPITEREIKIKLHPDDLEIIRQSYGEKEIQTRGWLLLSEPALQLGDVEIDAGESSVSYYLDERIRTTLHHFCASNHHIE